MNIRKFSINKACILLGILLLLAVGVVSAAIYLLTENITAVGYVFLFSVFVCLCVALRHLLCDPDPSETGHVLRFLLWSNG